MSLDARLHALEEQVAALAAFVGLGHAGPDDGPRLPDPVEPEPCPVDTNDRDRYRVQCRARQGSGAHTVYWDGSNWIRDKRRGRVMTRAQAGDLAETLTAPADGEHQSPMACPAFKM